jgi:hypothetical protein
MPALFKARFKWRMGVKAAGFSNLIWGTFYGKGGNSGFGTCVATDKKGNIYAGGGTSSTSNISTPGALQLMIGDSHNYGDGYVVKLDKNGARQWGGKSG